MDCKKVGSFIYKLRKGKGLTQKQLADAMHISDRAISKWERGLGCPDVSLLGQLANLLNVNIEDILAGNTVENDLVGGNMKRLKYYVCPGCSNLVVSTGNPKITCCGRVLEESTLKKAAPEQQLTVELVEDEWFLSSDHPMTKENYIHFIAFATGDRIQIIKQYPEWNVQTRISTRDHGLLIWYCTDDGLLYQTL